MADQDPDTVQQDDAADDHAPSVTTRLGDGLGRLSAILVFGPLGIAGRALHEGSKAGVSIITTLMPFAGKAQKALFLWALRQYHKKGGGDAVGLIHEPDGSVEPVPVKHKPQSIEEEDAERAGWHALDRDQSWHEGADGREVDRLGKTPIVFLDSASTQRATVTEARVAQCLDLDRVEGVYQVPSTDAIDMTVQVGSADAGVGGNGQAGAVPDGGMAWDVLEANVKKAAWEKSIIDIGVDDHDGMRIDPRKVKETYREKTGSEQLDEVERLGFLAGQLGTEDPTGFIIKVLLIALGFVAAAIIGPDLLSQASGAGGGGGLVPFWLGV
jgi:hypothetical protein